MKGGEGRNAQNHRQKRIKGGGCITRAELLRLMGGGIAPGHQERIQAEGKHLPGLSGGETLPRSMHGPTPEDLLC